MNLGKKLRHAYWRAARKRRRAVIKLVPLKAVRNA
jgi:hypothetical protein